MSKKTPRAELIEARIIEEQEWAYARWTQRYSYRQMRALGCLPPSEGGLGRDLSPAAYRHLVQQAREAAGDLTLSREERLERMNALNDDLSRELMRELEERRNETGRIDLKTLDALLAVQKREADLNGVDAAKRLDVEVTGRDKLDAEIEAMLARLDTPTEIREDADRG